jgi:hypothetical protein
VSATDTALPVATETVAPAVSEAPVTEAPAQSFDERLTADLLKTYDKIAPPRAANGKFAPKGQPDTAQTTEQTEAPEAAASGTDSATQPEEKKAEPAKPAIEPPNSWVAEQKAKWAAVPLETQEYILRRETESHQAITRLGEERKQYEQAVKTYEPFDQVVNAYAADFRQRNVHPAEGFRQLLEAQRALAADPLGALVTIGRSYGLDLAGLIQGQAQHPQDGQTAPPSAEVFQLRNELAQIKSHITGQQQREYEAEQQRQAAMQAERQTQVQALSQEIADFSKDKPHFESVRKTMAALMQAKAATTLADAYEKATFANPDIRTRILEDQRKADEGKRQAEAAKKAADAKKSAVVNVRSSTATGNTPRTMDDTLRETASRLYNERVA